MPDNMNLPVQPNPSAAPAPSLAPTDAAQVPVQPAPVQQATALQSTPPAQAQPQTSALSQPVQQLPQQVTNAPAPHPTLQKALNLRAVAQALAGGPQYKTTIDPTTGATTRTAVPLSKGQIGMAIALEALTGALAGAGARGPNAIGQGAALGLQQGQLIQQQRQAEQQRQDQQAQQDVDNQQSSLARKASLFETNSRSILNVSEAQAQGADALDKLIALNRQSGVLDVSPDYLDNGGQPMTEDELLAGMQAGKLSMGDHLGPVAGRVLIKGKDGTERWESTHLVVRNPDVKVPLTQQDFDRYADANVAGYPKGTKIGDDVMIPLRFKAQANEIAGSHYLANRRLQDLRNNLEGTAFAGKVPASIPFDQPGVETAMQAYQKYVSHNAENLADPLLTLQAMGNDKRDPKTGELQPNPDAKFTDTIASALGGWPLLQAAHDAQAARKADIERFSVIDTQDKATAVLSSPKRFTPEQQKAARSFLQLSQSLGAGKAGQEARAHAVANGSDVEAMYKFGKNPVTGEKLTLNNAPDAMLVDPSGNVVPQNLVTVYKPTALERQTADTARQVLAIAQNLRQAVAANPNLAGPLSGRSEQALAKAGLGDAQAQKYLDDISFLVSASTKMHTGRFSNEILKKMDQLIRPGMNPEQFGGALASITDVAQRYADEDRLVSVGEYRAQQQSVQAAQPTQTAQDQGKLNSGAGAPVRIVPAGATPGRDAQGNIVGYRTRVGQIVRF